MTYDTDMSFYKMHGLGNDFIILDHRGGQAMLSAQQIRQIADRHFGIGCDQLMIIKKAEDADISLAIYNADGSLAEACGNGTRCVASLMMNEMDKNEISIKTVSGTLKATRKNSQSKMITVDMGAVQLGENANPNQEQIDALLANMQREGLAVNHALSVHIGNPHIVFFCDDAASIAIEHWGPIIENNSLFKQKTNVEFVHLVDKNHLRMRVWERGVGITLACGSGACAAGVAAIETGLVDKKTDIQIQLDGGVLVINWLKSDDHVLMTGTVTMVARGIISADVFNAPICQGG